MSDISIPGVNSKYGTQTIIDSLVKVERNKLVKLQADQKTLEDTKVVWQSTNKYMQDVRDSAKVLYGFNTPFGSKVGTSGNEDALTVSATRAASNGNYNVKVLASAANDRLLSGSLALDKQIPSGDYLFKIGDKEVALTFKGGKLSSFVDAINLKKPDLLKASLIKDTAETQILQLEAVPVGAKNSLSFQKAAESTLKDLGMIGSPAGFRKVLLEKDTTVVPGASQTWAPESPISVAAGTELRMTVKVQVAPAPAAASTNAKGFVLPDSPAVTYEGITISGAAMKGDIPLPPPAAPPPEVRSMKGLSVKVETGALTLPELPDSETATSYTYVFPAATVLSSVDLANGNSARSITVSGISLVDPKVPSGLVATHPLSKASDAELDFEGIRVKRDSNAVSDLIPGVTLNLKGASDKPVSVKVEPDKKAIKDGIISFLASYNRLITDILVLTSIRDTNPAASPIITEASYLTDAEKSKAEANLGRFQGDIALNQTKNGLQRILMNPYPTDGSPFSLLAQIGISTNAANTGDKVNVSKLRGYLEVDEPKLDESIARDVDGVRKLFGNSTDGSLIVNTGAAFGVDELLKPATQLGGFNAMHISTIEGDLTAKKKEISNYNDYLTRYQQDLKTKYGNMEASLNALNKNSASLNALNSNTSGQ
ncbi:MAG: flagellar filament capping protein FliD [Spirochaetales bacterium]